MEVFKRLLDDVTNTYNFSSFNHWFYANISPLLVLLHAHKDNIIVSPLPLDHDFGYLKSVNNDNSNLLPHTEVLRFQRLKKNGLVSALKKKLYSRYLAAASLVNYQGKNLILKKNDFCISTNELMISTLKKIPLPVYNNTKLCAINQKSNFSKLHGIDFIKFRELLINCIAQYCASNDLSFPYESVKNLIDFMVFKMEFDINNINSNAINFLQILHTSSGGSYESMLFSHIKALNNYKIFRYEHGGERCFFDDKVFWQFELSGCDRYYTYSNHISKNYKKIHPHIDFHVSLSNYYGSTRQQTLTPIPVRTLLIGVSYVGEAVQVSKQKNLDFTQLCLESEVIKVMEKKGIIYTYKPHPKGFGLSYFDQVYGQQITETRTMSICLDDYTHVIVTYVGTAAIEAILRGKNVMYIDTGIRPRSTLFDDLNDVIFHFQFQNLYSSTLHSELEDAIIEFNCWNVSMDKIQEFKRKYYESN